MSRRQYTPHKVLNIFEMYLRQEISAQELSELASFIVLSDVYVNPEWEDDEQCDSYEPMWCILQQISTPEIDGEVDFVRVNKHVETLKLAYGLDIAENRL